MTALKITPREAEVAAIANDGLLGDFFRSYDFELAVDKLAWVLMSKELAADEMAQFVAVFNKVTGIIIPSEPADKASLEADIRRQCANKSSKDLEEILKKVRDALDSDHSLKNYKNHVNWMDRKSFILTAINKGIGYLDESMQDKLLEWSKKIIKAQDTNAEVSRRGFLYKGALLGGASTAGFGKLGYDLIGYGLGKEMNFRKWVVDNGAMGVGYTTAMGALMLSRVNDAFQTKLSEWLKSQHGLDFPAPGKAKTP